MQLQFPASGLLRINRNIMECKGFQSEQDRCQIFVLIETLWNVKLVPTILKILCPCINRNIMECKGRSILQNMRLQARINRNIMECKED